MTRKARRAILELAQAAAAAGRHELARELFATCRISYLATPTPPN